LRFELLRRVERRDDRPLVLLARGDPIGKSSAFGLIGQALRRLAGVFDGEPLLLRQAKIDALVAQRFPSGEQRKRLTEFLSEMSGAPFEDGSTLLRAARADAPLMGDQIRGAFEELVAAECSERPAMLVFEDLHWGDWPTVHLIDGALRRLATRPLMIVALARPEID